jgi:hypothetical protein
MQRGRFRRGARMGDLGERRRASRLHECVIRVAGLRLRKIVRFLRPLAEAI